MSFTYTLKPCQPVNQIRSIPTMSETSRWGTVTEAAELAGLSVMTIRRYIAAGDLPAKRLGVKLLRVDLDAVEALLQPVEVTK